MDHGNAYAALACVQTLVRDWSSVPGEVQVVSCPDRRTFYYCGEICRAQRASTTSHPWICGWCAGSKYAAARKCSWQGRNWGRATMRRCFASARGGLSAGASIQDYTQLSARSVAW